MVRFISLQYEVDDENTVKCTEVSYRKDGWYIEDIRLIDNYYDKREELLAPWEGWAYFFLSFVILGYKSNTLNICWQWSQNTWKTQIAVFWRICFPGHQSCRRTSKSKFTAGRKSGLWLSRYSLWNFMIFYSVWYRIWKCFGTWDIYPYYLNITVIQKKDDSYWGVVRMWVQKKI